MIKLIIFDLWQTLVYRDVNYSTTSKMLELTGLDISKPELVKIFENAIQTKKWRSKYEAYSNLCRKIKLEPTRENVALLMDIRDRAEEKTKVYPHTIAMLTQLKSQGYKTGLISNSSIFAIEQVRKRTYVLNYIDYPLFSYDVGVVKPDLKIFKVMLTRSGCEPAETIMIGDKLDDDVLPPRQLGMKAILFKDYNQLKKELSTYGVYLI